MGSLSPNCSQLRRTFSSFDIDSSSTRRMDSTHSLAVHPNASARDQARGAMLRGHHLTRRWRTRDDHRRLAAVHRATGASRPSPVLTATIENRRGFESRVDHANLNNHPPRISSPFPKMMFGRLHPPRYALDARNSLSSTTESVHE